jgi:hypothetical protein
MTGFDSKRSAAADKDALFEKFELAQPAQEQRPWVGLTDEDGCAMPQAWWDGALWAEAKLKERNT